MLGITFDLGGPAVFDCNQDTASVRAIVRTRSVNHGRHGDSIIDGLLGTRRSIMLGAAQSWRIVPTLNLNRSIATALQHGQSRIFRKGPIAQ
jgi:hypothetical protein